MKKLITVLLISTLALLLLLPFSASAQNDAPEWARGMVEVVSSGVKYYKSTDGTVAAPVSEDISWVLSESVEKYNGNSPQEPTKRWFGLKNIRKANGTYLFPLDAHFSVRLIERYSEEFFKCQNTMKNIRDINPENFFLCEISVIGADGNKMTVLSEQAEIYIVADEKIKSAYIGDEQLECNTKNVNAPTGSVSAKSLCFKHFGDVKVAVINNSSLMLAADGIWVQLLQDVSGKGENDDIIFVSDTYARNYLFPKGIAVEASVSSISERLSGKSVTIDYVEGKTVTALETANAIYRQCRVKVEEETVDIPEITQPGSYTATVKINSSNSFDITVEVTENGEGSVLSGGALWITATVAVVAAAALAIIIITAGKRKKKED